MPRVILVLFAYNQCDYVDDAMASLFAQDYPNLHIVLSDDASTDDTFARLKQAAADYAGPHHVTINQTSGGGGLLAHFYSAIEGVDGDLVVGAAGDDVSSPERVSKLVKAWQGTGAAGIYSGWNSVDQNLNFLRREGNEQQHVRDMATYFPNREIVIARGATAAYAMPFLRSFVVPRVPIWAEDYFLSGVAMFQGRNIIYLDEPLVSYRQNEAALRNFNSLKLDFLSYEKREQSFFATFEVLQNALENIMRNHPGLNQEVDFEAIEKDLTWYRYRANWSEQSMLRRFAFTLQLLDRTKLRWAMPRVIGLDGFIFIKTYFSRRITPLSPWYHQFKRRFCRSSPNSHGP